MIFLLKKITLVLGLSELSTFTIVLKYSPAVISHVAMSDGHSNIDHDILGVRVVNDAGQHLPGVEEGIALQKPIENTISGNLQLGTNTEGGTSSFSLANTFDNAFRIALKVESPLVQGTSQGVSGRSS